MDRAYRFDVWKFIREEMASATDARILEVLHITKTELAGVSAQIKDGKVRGFGNIDHPQNDWLRRAHLAQDIKSRQVNTMQRELERRHREQYEARFVRAAHAVLDVAALASVKAEMAKEQFAEAVECQRLEDFEMEA